MGQGNYEKREPPLIILWCPGSGGHYWAFLNPTYHEDRTYFYKPIWCDDHQEEKRQHVSEALSESAIKRSDRYADLGLPATKRCANPNPTKHEAGAVLPASKFYKRKSKMRVDGTQNIIIDSRCKECVKEAEYARRSALPEEERKRRDRQASLRFNERRAKGRRALRQERNKMLEIGPLNEWLREYQIETQQTETEIALRCGLEHKVIRQILNPNGKRYVYRSTVDAMGIALDNPWLLNNLYPPKDADAA